MKIHMARHGQTDLNKKRVKQGSRTDHSLNEEDVKQAKELAESLGQKNFDIIFSSTLKRALETAKIVSKDIGTPIVTDKRLIERDFGTLSGKKVDQVRIDFPQVKEGEEGQTYDYSPFGGESAGDVKKRVLEFLDEIKEEYQDKNVLVITHGGILKLMQFLSGEEKVFTPNNAKLYTFDI